MKHMERKRTDTLKNAVLRTEKSLMFTDYGCVIGVSPKDAVERLFKQRVYRSDMSTCGVHTYRCKFDTMFTDKELGETFAGFGKVCVVEVIMADSIETSCVKVSSDNDVELASYSLGEAIKLIDEEPGRYTDMDSIKDMVSTLNMYDLYTLFIDAMNTKHLEGLESYADAVEQEV